MVLALLFTGCGAKTATDEELLAGMKEFALVNGSASLYLNKEWTTQETGLDNLLIAGTDDGEEAVFLMQFPKDSIYYQVESIDDMKAIIDDSFHISGEEETEAFEIPGMSNVSVVRCEITPDDVKGEACVAYGETDYAFYAIGYVGDKWDDSTMASLQVSCSKFAESETALEEINGTTAELTDTIRWFNASYAVLTELNGWDYNLFGGAPANDTTKQIQITSLEEWWNVTDRTSADETLDWILEEGHRTAFAEDMAYLDESGLGQAADREGFLSENSQMTSDEIEMYLSLYGMYEEYGESAIDGWDYCRALNLMSFYYLAGYYTEQEALDKSLEIAQTVQPLFESWDDLIASYMRGYEYWAEESSAERQAVYEDIKTRDDNPYQVDFKMELEKTW